MILLFFGLLIAIGFWQYRRLRLGRASRARAIGAFTGHGLLVLAGYGLGCFALVGLEELSGQAIIGEEHARAFPLLMLVGALAMGMATLLFSLLTLTVRPDRKRSP